MVANEKYFFYLLDVETENVLVFCRLATDDNKMNLPDFKMKLIMGLLGNKYEAVEKAPGPPKKEPEH
jgi:hypothetical protein